MRLERVRPIVGEWPSIETGVTDLELGRATHKGRNIEVFGQLCESRVLEDTILKPHRQSPPPPRPTPGTNPSEQTGALGLRVSEGPQRPELLAATYQP